jgi:hypothetical protein
VAGDGVFRKAQRRALRIDSDRLFGYGLNALEILIFGAFFVWRIGTTLCIGDLGCMFRNAQRIAGTLSPWFETG